MVNSGTIATVSVVSIILIVSVAYFFVVYPQISGKPLVPETDEEEVSKDNIYLIVSLIVMVVVGILATKFTNSTTIGIVSTVIVAVVFVKLQLWVVWHGRCRFLLMSI